MLRVNMGDVAFWPRFWEVEPLFAVANLKTNAGRTDSQYACEWRKV